MQENRLLSELNDMAARSDWLENSASSLQKGVEKFYGSTGKPGRLLKDFLNGTWLGHPLHPVLVDIPIGSWTAAIVLDWLGVFSGKKRLGKAADVAIGVGVAGAGAAAVAGMTDWHYTSGEARRLGLVHALLNTTALFAFITSLFARSSRNRGLGRALALGGYLIAGFSAYLGGDLVFRQKIGVNRAKPEVDNQPFAPVLRLADLPEGSIRRVDVHGRRVLLRRVNGRGCAIDEVCAHMGGPLSEGHLSVDGVVECPWHASRFEVCSGEVVNGPSAYPQPQYEVQINGDQIEVRITHKE